MFLLRSAKEKSKSSSGGTCFVQLAPAFVCPRGFHRPEHRTAGLKTTSTLSELPVNEPHCSAGCFAYEYVQMRSPPAEVRASISRRRNAGRSGAPASSA